VPSFHGASLKNFFLSDKQAGAAERETDASRAEGWQQGDVQFCAASAPVAIVKQYWRVVVVSVFDFLVTEVVDKLPDS